MSPSPDYASFLYCIASIIYPDCVTRLVRSALASLRSDEGAAIRDGNLCIIRPRSRFASVLVLLGVKSPKTVEYFTQLS